MEETEDYRAQVTAVLAEGRNLLRQNRIREAFLFLHEWAARDRDVCELALQLTYPCSRVRKLEVEDIEFLRQQVQQGWQCPDFYNYLYAVHLIENRQGPENVREAMTHLDSCYSNYLGDRDIGDACYLKARIHQFGWDGLRDDYRYADLLSLSSADDSQRARLYSIGQRIYGSKSEQPFPEGAIAKLREVLHIQHDNDIDESGDTFNDLQHPALWGLLSRAYKQAGNPEMARRAARREIREGLVEIGELDLELEPCDPRDPLREFSAHDDPRPSVSTEQHLDRPWHSLKTYHPPRPEEERAPGTDGMTEMERRNAFNEAMLDFPTREQLKARERAERKLRERQERERREQEALERRLAALKGKPIQALYISGRIVAVDPGLLHVTPCSTVVAPRDIQIGQDLLRGMPEMQDHRIPAVIVKQAELDAVTFQVRDETVTLHLGESYDSGEIGLDYAYAMFRIEAK